MPALADDTPRVLTRHLPVIESALQGAIGSGESPLAHATRYVMGWEDETGLSTQNQGKRIRPALCLFASEAFGGPIAAAMPGAIAVELVHNFSLVHDEVQDRDAEHVADGAPGNHDGACRHFPDGNGNSNRREENLGDQGAL